LKKLVKAVLKNAKENGGERDRGADLASLIDYLCQVCDGTGLKISYTHWENDNPCCSSAYLDLWAENADEIVKRAHQLMADDLKRLEEAVKAAGKEK
jgi:hypothetical protein